MKKVLSLVMVLAFTATALFAQDKLPAAKVATLDGKKVDVSSLLSEDGPTVISFWATWCSPCKKEMENIADLYEDWQEDYGAEFIAISIDDARTKAKVKPYIDGKGYDYTVVIDDNKTFFKALNGSNPPLTIIVDKDGNILKRKVGYVEGDEYEIDKVLEKHSH